MTTPVPIMTVCSDTGRSGVPGKWVACVECKKKIYLSDSTVESAMEKFDDVIFKAYCLPCGSSYLSINPIPIMKMTQKQKDEIEKHVDADRVPYEY